MLTEQPPPSANLPVVCTIGHSTRPIREFLGLLATNAIAHLLDVRTVPRSRHNPQFTRENLSASLRSAGIRYTHLPGLGGLRRPRVDSPNGAWRNDSFRGYADYMQTPEFADDIAYVTGLAKVECCTLMCAEAVPWRCHRSLIADALTVRGIRVEDIIGAGGRSVHKLTPFAHVDGVRITYPVQVGANAELFEADRENGQHRGR